ncbi:MAG: FG-GAP-like repeat-containing protein, partial [Gammaproteobacteria bacterium]|nr:FG-GAP-like repeat-containing protein [Gammaproteobacteria bacterium]
LQLRMNITNSGNSSKRLIIIGLLMAYIAFSFWGGSRYPALNDKATMGSETRLEDSLSFEVLLQIQEGDAIPKRIAYSTVNWVNTNKQGMTFGVLFAGGFLTFLGMLRRRSFKGSYANALMGFVIGTPLGVCVNCAAPIAKGLHEAGARLETTLSTMFSSPTMNIVVLTMVFTIFPFYLAMIKLASTLIFILLLIPLMSRYLFHKETLATHEPLNCAFDTTVDVSLNESWPQALLATGREFLKNLWFIIIRTVPLMFLAGLLGAVFVTLFPLNSFITSEYSFPGLLLVSLIGVFLPAPIALDVVLASALMASGLPIAYVMALLFTLGIYSVYPFMIIWKSISLRLAVVLYLTVAAVGMVAAYVAQNYNDWEVQRMLNVFGEAHAAELETVITGDGIRISSTDLSIRNKNGDRAFSKIEGDDIGLVRPNLFSVEDIWPPFYYGRGIASGDVNNDGWDDILVATEKGPLLYRNNFGKDFTVQKIDVPEIARLNVFIVALVDINNDGWLDIFLTAYHQGNHYIISDKGKFEKQNLVSLPITNNAVALGLTFGDMDKDGDLDAAVGNWFYGWPKEIPTEAGRNFLLINQDRQLTEKKLEGITGETLSMLFTDYNHDQNPDLIVANDFIQPDIFYTGDGKGGLKEITRADGIIPVSTDSTMSIDTGDINNDLQLEIYLDQIAAGASAKAARRLSRGLQYYCDDIKNEKQQKDCKTNIDIRGFFKIGSKHQPSDIKYCKSITSADEQKACMAMMVMKTAVQSKKPELCRHIPNKQSRAYLLCDNYFKNSMKTTKAEYQHAIPQRLNQNVLLLSDAEGKFTDKAEQYHVDIAGWGWNAKFADLDNDEWLDLYVVNGTIRRALTNTNFFFRNLQGKDFADKTMEFGLDGFMAVSSYTYLDFDNDGDLDIVTTSINGPLWVYINNSENNSIIFKLQDQKGNRFGIGSKLVVHYGPDNKYHQVRELKAGGGFISFDAPSLHFGLGKHDKVNKIEIFWSTGEQVIINQPFKAGRSYQLERL